MQLKQDDTNVNTPGKGPFARPVKNIEIINNAKHWQAPRVDLTPESVASLLKFCKNRCDAGVFDLFKNLALMPATARLARNLSQTIRCLVGDIVTSALADGLSINEHNALFQLEKCGIAIELLGVAHELLNIREREITSSKLNELFFDARINNKTLIRETDESNH